MKPLLRAEATSARGGGECRYFLFVLGGGGLVIFIFFFPGQAVRETAPALGRAGEQDGGFPVAELRRQGGGEAAAAGAAGSGRRCVFPRWRRLEVPARDPAAAG